MLRRQNHKRVCAVEVAADAVPRRPPETSPCQAATGRRTRRTSGRLNGWMALTTRCPRAWFTIAPRYQHRDYAIEAARPLVRCLSARGKPGSGPVATCGMPAEQGRRSLHAQWLSLVAATAQRAAVLRSQEIDFRWTAKDAYQSFCESFGWHVRRIRPPTGTRGLSWCLGDCGGCASAGSVPVAASLAYVMVMALICPGCGMIGPWWGIWWRVIWVDCRVRGRRSWPG